MHVVEMGEHVAAFLNCDHSNAVLSCEGNEQNR